MLDQPDFIKKFDKEDSLGVIASQPEQLLHKFGSPGHLDKGRLDNIVLAGMGGSALAGELCRNWLSDRLKVPFEIVRDYRLPEFVSDKTLVVCSSYSGNTEETLSALDDALEAGAKVVVMAAGGKLVEKAEEKGLPRYILPGGLQPRLAVLYGVRAWAELLEQEGLASGLVEEVEKSAKWATGELEVWKADKPTADNAAKQIASDLVGHPVVVYGAEALRLPAMKWKIDFNENSKNIAFWNVFPEWNHNEFNGWSHPERSGHKVVYLKSSFDHPRVVERFDVVARLLSNVWAPIEVQAIGETRLEQILWTLILGDFVSAYLAFLNGIDPTPVDLVEKLKKELG